MHNLTDIFFNNLKVLHTKSLALEFDRKIVKIPDFIKILSNISQLLALKINFKPAYGIYKLTFWNPLIKISQSDDDYYLYFKWKKFTLNLDANFYNRTFMLNSDKSDNHNSNDYKFLHIKACNEYEFEEIITLNSIDEIKEWRDYFPENSKISENSYE